MTLRHLPGFERRQNGEIMLSDRAILTIGIVVGAIWFALACVGALAVVGYVAGYLHP